MRVLSRCFAVLVLVALVVDASAGGAKGTENMTPLLLDVQDAPVPFMGSDGRMHLVYELWMTNFSSADVSVEKVEVISAHVVLQSLDAAAIAGRLQAAGQRESAGKLAGSAQGLLFLHVALAAETPIPTHLSHRVSVHASAAPAGRQEITETAGGVRWTPEPF